MPTDDAERNTEDLLRELELLTARVHKEHLARLFNRIGHLYRLLKDRGVTRRVLADRAGVSRKAVDNLAGRAPRRTAPLPRAKKGEAERCRRCDLSRDVVALNTEGICVDCVYETGEEGDIDPDTD